jgi:hypothetical protein
MSMSGLISNDRMAITKTPKRNRPISTNEAVIGESSSPSRIMTRGQFAATHGTW